MDSLTLKRLELKAVDEFLGEKSLIARAELDNPFATPEETEEDIAEREIEADSEEEINED